MFEDPTADSSIANSAPTAASAPRDQDPDYLYRRAEQELELAQAATHPAVVKAHYLLADHYLDSLYADGSPAEG